MERHIGETFDGIVVGKSRFAYYVKLENGIEGAVYLGAKRGAAKSRGRPQTPREKDFPNFGTKLRVKLVSVERAYGRIDFEPVK
jgi:exoribonuclease R